MCNDIFIGSNDVLLKFTLDTCDGTTLSLSNSTVKFILYRGNNYIEKECTIDDEENGQCSYLLKMEDVPNIGQYFTQLQVIYSDGNIYYSDIKTLNVKQNLINNGGN